MRRGAERVRQCCSLRNLSHILLFASSQTALAHEADAARATFLHLVSWPLFPLLLVFVLYSLGLRQLWRGGGGRGVSCIQVGSFIAGGALVLITWSGPLNRGAASSLAAHVAQHMVLMAAVPPLLLLGRPGVVTLGLLPTRTARALTAPLRKARRLQFWALLASPVTAMLVQSAVMWSWHLPAAMDLACQLSGDWPLVLGGTAAQHSQPRCRRGERRSCHRWQHDGHGPNRCPADLRGPATLPGLCRTGSAAWPERTGRSTAGGAHHVGAVGAALLNRRTDHHGPLAAA